MNATRREFLETSIGSITVLGVSLWDIPGLLQSCAGQEPRRIAEIPLIWMATGACTGCSVSLLNAAAPTARFVLVGDILPDKRTPLAFHTTVMASSGDMAMQALDKVVQERSGGYLLIIDGATATKKDGMYCAIGEKAGKSVTAYELVRDLGRNAMAAVAVGTCSAFGGIPAAGPNPTGCLSLGAIFKREKIQTPIVNLPGCPPHPDWIVGTVAALLLGGLSALKLDEHGRPAIFYSRCIHDHCPYRGYYERGEFAQKFGDHGCLVKLGCKGPVTHADCPIRKWNNGKSWCVQAGHPCIGCVEPGFPYEGSLFATVTPAQLTFPGTYPSTTKEVNKQADSNTYAAIGMIGVAAFLAGVGVATAAKKLQPQGLVQTGEEAKGGGP
jgi:hydrogenase small subunit